MFRKVIFDVDQTLVDTTCLEEARHNRNWTLVYQLMPQARLYEGMNEVFGIIRKCGISVALVTTTPRSYVERIAQTFHIPYAHIVSYHDAPPKPSPAPMAKALQLLEAEPFEVLSFGDREIDIQSSNGAGIESIACFWGTKEPEKLWKSGYRHAIRTPKEIFTLLR